MQPASRKASIATKKEDSNFSLPCPEVYEKTHNSDSIFPYKILKSASTRSYNSHVVEETFVEIRKCVVRDGQKCEQANVFPQIFSLSREALRVFTELKSPRRHF